jgi:UDP-glucose 6-dehydrogenase
MKETVLVIGLGEVGMSIYELTQESGLYGVYGLDQKIDLRQDIPEKVDIIHICIPFSNFELFVNSVVEYVLSFQPRLLIIDSTIPPRTTERISKKCSCMVVHSPVFGTHRNRETMKFEMKFYGKLVGGVTAEATIVATDHFNKIGIPTRVNKSPLETEVTKLYCTSYYGILIALSQEFHRLSSSVGADFSEVTGNICYLHEKSYVKPPVYPDVIGGHCVMPNIELVLSLYDSALLKAIVESNEKRKIDVQTSKVSEEISKVKEVVEGFMKRFREKK